MQAYSQSPFNLVVIKYDSFFCAEDNGENHVESDSPLEIAESVNYGEGGFNITRHTGASEHGRTY